LIIKLGALGDVIRTTPLVHKIREEYPNAEIWWITESPKILPASIGKIMDYSPKSLVILQQTEFSRLICLDKDIEACALASSVNAEVKLGYHLVDGRPAPIDENAVHKFLTGLFDDVNQANTKSYPEEIFEICGWEFKGEDYLLEYDSALKWNLPKEKKIIGLNTGCGDRWISRLWPDESWIELIGLLKSKGHHVLLLGGKAEHEKNLRLQEMSGADYKGHYPLQDFMGLMDRCDVIVSAVTMAMHITIGLKKPLVLMNNIFNPHEFEMYGRGTIVQPDKKCECYFSSRCTNAGYFCMNHLPASKIAEAVEKEIEVAAL
jgi:heptosyltransferase-2